MKFKKFAATILAILGLSEWTRTEEGVQTLTDDEAARLTELGFSDSFIQGFKKALSNDFADENVADAAPNTRAAVLQGLLADTAQRLSSAEAALEQYRRDAAASAETIAQREQEIARLNDRVRVLGSLPEQDPGQNAGSKGLAPQLNLQDDKQLAGMSGAMYALDRPYNMRAKAKLMERAGYHMTAMPMAKSIDYSTLKEDLGAFYLIPWQSRLQSFLMQLPSIETIFPLESGYQDLAVLTNIWLGEFSQSDNTASDFDKVVKGEYSFDNETLRMFNVMFAHRFKNLKELERTWIGTLNLEGSNPIKWSFIEYILVETAKKLHNEREMRRINGVRVEPDLNTPGRAMAAADGLYEFLRKKIDGHTDILSGKTVYQVKPFVLGEITQANIGEKLYKATEMIPSVLRDSGQLVCYLPSYMIVWYHKYNELHYGTNQDYTADIMYIKEYPSVRIKPVPNADNHCRVFWTLDGNIHTYEDQPGEMYNFSLEQEDWSLKVWSNWRESIWAMAVGFKYIDPEEMDYSRQMIFANEYDLPASYFIDGTPDANPSVAQHTSVRTVSNTALFTITDIEDAKVGVPVTIMCGSIDKGVRIQKSGNFSLISSAWTPTRGDRITLMKRADGKFIEISRATASVSALEFEANDNTPSVAGGTEFVVGANTSATAITALDDADEGVVYTVYGAGSTNASTIANSGNFVLTAAITLSDGKFIKLVKAADGKFYELARG